MAELAQAAGVGVDTVRFYQARGLIPPPARKGRYAIYGGAHLERIRRIRSLLDSGFSLAQIRRLLDGPDGSASAAQAAPPPDEAGLLAALAAQRVGEGTLSRAELADESGVPEALLAAAVGAGLIAPVEIDGQERFPRSDLELVVAALELLGMGMPLDRLLQLAALHASNVDQLADEAIDLFDDHVRKPLGRRSGSSVRRASSNACSPECHPQMVALHFQRTVVTRALAAAPRARRGRAPSRRRSMRPERPRDWRFSGVR